MPFPLSNEYLLVADAFDDVADQLELWEARYGTRPPASGKRSFRS